MKKVNVLFIMPQMAIGGTENLIYSLARNLDRKKFNPELAWFYGEKTCDQFKKLEIPLYHIPKLKRFDILTMKKLGDILKKDDIDIVNAHHFMPMFYAFYGSKIKHGVKLVYTEHSKWEIEQVSFKWKIIGCYLMKKLDAVVGVSKLVTDSLQSKFKITPAKIHTIKNGIEIDKFTKNKNRFLKDKLNIADDTIIIGIIANFRKVKNHIFLLKAFNELLQKDNKVKLLLIGKGFKGDSENTEGEIRKFIYEKKIDKKVLLLGHRSDIPALLSIIDIFCLTSKKEGLPLSILEAMAAGIPIVGTDVEGIRDVICNGENGFLVKLDDVSGLKDILHVLINNKSLIDKLSRNSKNIAKEFYSLDYCIRGYEDLFISLMSK